MYTAIEVRKPDRLKLGSSIDMRWFLLSLVALAFAGRLHEGDLQIRSDRVAEVLRTTPAVRWAVHRISSMLLSPPVYTRPVGSFMQHVTDYQPTPALPGSEDLLVSVREFILPHLQAAIQLPHPRASTAYNAAQDIQDAARHVMSFDGNARAVSEWRLQREADLQALRGPLAGCEAKLRALMGAAGRRVLKGDYSLSLTACMRMAVGSPDELFTAHQIYGFPCLDDYPDSGMFRVCEKPAAEKFDDFFHPKHQQSVADTLNRAAADAKQYDSLVQLTTKTRAEVMKGLAQGPFTEADCNIKYGECCWRALHRFAVWQGFDDKGRPKCRPCDNARRSKTNLCASLHETIACEQPSFPAMMCMVFADLNGGIAPFPMHHSTDDVESAYRRMLSAHPQCTVIAIYDTIERGVRYYTMDGHNFGLITAVLSFNRHSQLMCMIARRLFGVCVAGYFDDYDITEPTFCGASGKHSLAQLHRWLGVPLAGHGVPNVPSDKNVPPRNSNAFLGIVSDLTQVMDGIIVMKAKVSRVAGIVVTFMNVMKLEVPAMHRQALREVIGKLEYTCLSSCSGRFGRAALSILNAYAGSPSSKAFRGKNLSAPPPLPDEVIAALLFFMILLPLLPHRKIYLGVRSKLKPVVIYTDARYSPEGKYKPQIGICIYFPERAPGKQWLHDLAVIPPDLMDRFHYRVQQVGQLEALAAIAPYLTWPDQLRGRDVIHFIDNTGAEHGLRNGYSCDSDSARLIHVFHAAVAALSCNVWFEYVPSAANISDIPSRLQEGEKIPDVLTELGSRVDTDHRIVIPAIGANWSDVFHQVFEKLAPRPTRAEKKYRAAVAAEVRRLRS